MPKCIFQFLQQINWILTPKPCLPSIKVADKKECSGLLRNVLTLCSCFFVLQGLWLVCGFFTNLPTVNSLQCYACADYPDSETPCNGGASVIQCESYFDSCSSQTTTFEFFGQDYTTTVKNCSLAQYSCDPAFTCDVINSSVASSGGTMKQCDLNCCESDLCNGQGGGSCLFCYSQKFVAC